jgi:hypothetical protein
MKKSNDTDPMKSPRPLFVLPLVSAWVCATGAAGAAGKPSATQPHAFASSTPAPRPAVRLPEFKSKLKNLVPQSKPESKPQIKPVVIAPQAPPNSDGNPPSPFRFEAPGPGRVELVFRPEPGMELSTSKALLVEVIAPEPASISPAVVTEVAWPKSGRLPLKLAGGTRGQAIEIVGNASYVLCKKGGTACQRKKSKFKTRVTL